MTSPSDIMPSALASEFLRAQDYYKVFSRFLMEGNREFWTSVLAPQSVEGIHLRSGPGCTCAGCKVRIRREAWINERTVPAERHDQVVTLAGQLGDEFDPCATSLSISWAAFFISIGAAALYQYAAIKFFEKSVFPEAYVPAVLRPLMKKGPGEAYGIMVACFSIGGIFILVYSYTLAFLTK